MGNAVKWHPLSSTPKQNGYVLLAITHYNIPMVLMGFYKRTSLNHGQFTEETYNGRGVVITHWAEPPTHPWNEKKDNTGDSSVQGTANHCPACGSDDLDYDTYEVFDHAIEYPWKCKSCGASGKEIGIIAFGGHEVKKSESIMEEASGNP